MFIKWRLYQRQIYGKKGDKYIQQPIIVRSYRVGIKKLREMYPNIPDERFENPEVRKKVFRPRHEVILKLPSYPVCMTVYFRKPEFMKQRYLWWMQVDAILDRMAEVRSDVTEETVKKLKDDIETVVPRVTKAEAKKLSVVLNDLPLHL